MRPRVTDIRKRHDRDPLRAPGRHAVPVLAPHLACVRHRLRIADRLIDEAAVALTFDDGPHAAGTPATLEALREANVRATFFLVGEQVERYPSLAAEIAAAGHAIGVHCQRHRNQLRLTPRQLREDLTRAHARIAETTG